MRLMRLTYQRRLDVDWTSRRIRFVQEVLSVFYNILSMYKWTKLLGHAVLNYTAHMHNKNIY